MPPPPCFLYASGADATAPTATVLHQVRLPSGEPVPGDWATTELPLPLPLGENQLLVSTKYISVDPYMRPGMNGFKRGGPVRVFGGATIGAVVESTSSAFSRGDLVIGPWGWSTRAVVPADAVRKLGPEHTPPTRALNVLGSNGLTAHLGLYQILKPQRGQVIFVSGGAGSVGATVGMLAKREGCRVIGSAGTAAKLEFMLSIGFDDVFNYKDEGVASALARPTLSTVSMPTESVTSSGPIGMPDWRPTFSMIAGLMPSPSISMPSAV